MEHLHLGPPSEPGRWGDWPECWEAELLSPVDIGNGVSIRQLVYGPERKWIGLVEERRRPDGLPCSGYLLFAVPEAEEYAAHYVGGATTRWTVDSWEPLTLSPSVACKMCPNHGYIRNGTWVPA